MKWWRRIRAGLGFGILWALAWGSIGGFLMEAIIDRNGRIIDMWPQALAIPGFLCGVIFSVVLSIAERRHKFDELTLGKMGLWGAIAGVLVILLGMAIGLNFPVAAMLVGPVAVLSAASATGTVALARKANDQQLLSDGDR